MFAIVVDASCTKDHDIVSIFDLSPTIPLFLYDQVKQFILEFASEFKFESNIAKFSLVSSIQGIQIHLGDSDNISDFQQSVLNISPASTSLFSTSEAIQIATKELIEHGRLIVPKTILLITNKSFKDRKAVFQSAAVARSMGVRLVVIGIGDQVQLDDLQAITADINAVKLLKNVTRSNALNDVKKSLIQYVCCKFNFRACLYEFHNYSII